MANLPPTRRASRVTSGMRLDSNLNRTTGIWCKGIPCAHISIPCLHLLKARQTHWSRPIKYRNSNRAFLQKASKMIRSNHQPSVCCWKIMRTKKATGAPWRWATINVERRLLVHYTLMLAKGNQSREWYRRVTIKILSRSSTQTLTLTTILNSTSSVKIILWLISRWLFKCKEIEVFRRQQLTTISKVYLWTLQIANSTAQSNTSETDWARNEFYDCDQTVNQLLHKLGVYLKLHLMGPRQNWNHLT